MIGSTIHDTHAKDIRLSRAAPSLAKDLDGFCVVCVGCAIERATDKHATCDSCFCGQEKLRGLIVLEDASNGQGWRPRRLSDGRVDFLASLVRVCSDLKQIFHQQGVPFEGGVVQRGPAPRVDLPHAAEAVLLEKSGDEGRVPQTRAKGVLSC